MKTIRLTGNYVINRKIILKYPPKTKSDYTQYPRGPPVMAAPTIASGNKKYTAQPVRRGAHNRAPVMRWRGTRSRIVSLSLKARSAI